MIRRWLIPGALLLVLVGSVWMLRQLGAGLLGQSQRASRHDPDFFMERFVTTTMDEQGRPKRRLEARYLAHFPDSDTHELLEPYVVMYRERAEPWHVRSERAWTSAGGDVLLLLGEVHIWRNDGFGKRKVDIETRDLRVLPDSDYGETEEEVVIRTPTSNTRGVGMRAWLDRSRLELGGGVRTVIERGAAEEGLR